MKIVAHRGNAPGFQEMTPAAFEHALQLPIHGIEADVRMCATGELVLHHDARLGRCAPGRKRISGASLEHLRSLNFGTEANPQQILTLDELLEMIIHTGDKHFYLEIKHPTRFGRQVEVAVAETLQKHGLLSDERIHIISFSHVAIRRMQELAPDLDRIYLRRHWELRYNPNDIQASNPHALGLSVRTARVRPELVGAQNKPTYMWTANNRTDIQYAIESGVDILATDKPQLAHAVLEMATKPKTTKVREVRRTSVD